MSGNRSAWICPSGKIGGPRRQDVRQRRIKFRRQARLDLIRARPAAIQQRPPAVRPQGVDPSRRVSRHRRGEAGQCRSDRSAVLDPHPPRPDARQECRDRGMPPGQHDATPRRHAPGPAEDRRARAAPDAPSGPRNHGSSSGSTRFSYSVRMKSPCGRSQRVIGVFNAFGDAAERDNRADVVISEEGCPAPRR